MYLFLFSMNYIIMPRKIRASRRNKRGGSYSSASSYGVYVNGGQNAQYDRTLGVSGPYSNVQGNVIIGAQGQNVQTQGVPTSENLSLVQSAGKRRRSSSKRSRRGGFFGSVVNQAIVPFSILGMQQTYRRKRHGGKKTKRRH